MEVLGELLPCMLGVHECTGVRRIVTTLDFIQHHLTKMGHRIVLVTTYTGIIAKEHIHPAASATPSGFVQTRLY